MYNHFCIEPEYKRKQGAQTLGIDKFVRKMMLRHWDPFQKFEFSPEKIASDISSIM